MHELVPADRKADVRRTRRNGREEDQVTRFDLVRVDGRTGAKLIDGQAWNLDSVLGEDVVHEAATVEPRWGGAPVAIRGATQRECRSGDTVAIRSAACRERRAPACRAGAERQAYQNDQDCAAVHHLSIGHRRGSR